MSSTTVLTNSQDAKVPIAAIRNNLNLIIQSFL